jgi:endonuclease YncB( thermonuclease family)
VPQAKGLLRVQGTLDVTQFRPGGESDADTIKVLVSKIEFSPDRTAHLPFAVVHVFDNAFVKGAQGPPKAPISKGKLTIRLQRVDATELHFAATLPKTGLIHNGTRYRQHLGESATVKLHDLISSTSKKNPVSCEVVTFVDHPNDVFDTYGRMVGDVLVNRGGAQVNLNQWLAENGWAFPTFYNSMSETEIKTLAGFAATAPKAKKVFGSTYPMTPHIRTLLWNFARRARSRNLKTTAAIPSCPNCFGARSDILCRN